MTNAPGAAPDDAQASQSRNHITVTICNERGLHARASAKFVQCAEKFDAAITVTRDNQSVGGTSIMGLMMLAACPGSILDIAASGPDADVALAALQTLVDDGFGEIQGSRVADTSPSIDQP